MFTEISETCLELKVVLGDDTVVRAVGRGTVCFDKESMEPMVLRDVLYVKVGSKMKGSSGWRL